MPFPFELPTTSSVPLQQYFDSPTHPSLPVQASSHGSILRAALSSWRSGRKTKLEDIERAAEDYISYLSALEKGVSRQVISGEEVDVLLVKEVRSRWSSMIADSRTERKVRIGSLDAEIAFVLVTLAAIDCLVARVELHRLHGEQQEKDGVTATATKRCLSAHAIYDYLAARAKSSGPSPSMTVDIAPQTLTALSELSLAEANLLAVSKDDPYPMLVAQGRDRTDKEWMIKAPEIPRVRAHLYARVCVAASDHASRAANLLDKGIQDVDIGSSKVDPDLIKYARDTGRASRARACRMLGIDAEREGDVPIAIAWLRAGKLELSGGKANTKDLESGKTSTFTKFKKEWKDRREDKKSEKDGDWGLDGGKAEEGRVLDMLEAKWMKLNNTVNTQPIPLASTVVSKLPSGREFHTNLPTYNPRVLDAQVIAGLRAPPSPQSQARGRDEDTDSSDDDVDRTSTSMVGAFPEDRNGISSRAYY
ncbi:MAG: hypothetical protein M1828_000837 [Chrysothrix sp. TS-e1954]|nr:MAG: hypothetical protein M1828_000837 [Chrysothrix sp. TS-e1954]